MLDFEAVYVSMHEEIRKFFLHRVFPADVADQLTADFFCHLYEKREKYHGDTTGLGTPSPWVYRLAHNFLTDWFRSRGRHVNTKYTIPLGDVGEACDTTAHVDTTELRGDLEAALSLLPPGQQRAIAYRFIYGHTIAETAQLMGKTDDAIKKLQHRGLNALRKILTNDVPRQMRRTFQESRHVA